MRQENSLRSAARAAAVLGAALIVTVPGTANAKTAGVTVRTPGATVGPATPFTGVSSHADCDHGLITGGGVDQAIGTGPDSNGNHVMGIAPSPGGTTEYTDTPGVVGHDVTHWLAFGGSGSHSSPSFSTTPYALCFESNRIRHTQVVMNKIAGPSTGLSDRLVTATCPTGTVLLGGGARTTPASVGSLKPIASFPTFNDAAHDFGKKAAADGETHPDSWTAVGGIGGGRDTNNTTYAYAVCSAGHDNVRHVVTTVHFREVSGPDEAATGQTATVGCRPEDGSLISGGAAISGGNVTTTDFTKTASGGPHLNGSFPSDSAGNPVGDGTAGPTHWTAATHAGGSPSPNSYTDGWALCLNAHRRGED
ncbi:hypothetical protein GCM10010211_33360 [Streptomyces albospinus]|uniref:Uncharacterized protein n=1 Tax=Streptomyces albospinus TaxID=285515 RepID=A0ABQ2V275_9ACTN|nr:hypothetical protein [Streptomyces albospinus]GGU65521.1 hypothetical protein GCM10010211_33360 [Streptomyces albospinus]